MTRPTTTGKAQDLITFTRSTTGTYLGSDGLLKSAAINEARIEYDASGNCLGLLVEEARTNVAVQSESFSSWRHDNIVVSVDSSITSPAGNAGVSKLTLQQGGNTKKLEAPNAIASFGNTACFSVWLKYGTHQYVDIYGAYGQWMLRNSGCKVDMLNGTVTDYTSSTASTIQEYPNGWYYVQVTSSTSMSGANATPFYLWASDASSGPISGTTSTGYFYAWGAQTEVGSFPTSYIPTSGSTVTRAKDVASLAVSEFGYNQDQGTVFINYDAKYNSSYSASSYTRIAELQSDANNRMTLYLGHDDSAAALYIRTSSSNQGSPATTNVAQVGLDKVAFSVASNSANICLNGGTVGVSTSVTVPSVTSLLIGDSNAAGYLNGHIKSIQYYPLRLSNAQLQALTV